MEATRARMDSLQYSNGNTQCFSKDSFMKLKEIMYEYKAAASSFLFWEGDLADKLYYLKKGRVKITKSTDDGKEFVLYMYQEGDFFGQIDPFNNSRHSFNAEALDECTIGVVQKADLEIVLWQHGDLAIEFMKWMGLMHRLTQTKFRDLMMYGKPGALCSTLIRLANSYGEPVDNGVRISKKLTNTELADMIGATRESVNRLLSDLKKIDVVHFDNGYIVVQNIEYLQGICHCEMCPKEICRI
jgi:CRP/FNR family transcriptional regulator, cyclic AMP receptor protein